jgi:lipopolysaccharide transport system ATP-binding protein
MRDVAIQVEQLSKRYRLGGTPSVDGSLREALASVASRWRARPRKSANNSGGGDFWALRDVSFDVKRGEVMGVVGRNGAGKSTLLKILSRITDPSEGAVDIDGRVGSLLEVGTGFHPELSGRENIYLNGTILGMRRKEIDERFDAIVDFSGVEKFLDTPVKRYSSGMTVRLAFAVAAHLDPEILIVDEVLAVGDVAFQKKCLGRIREVASSNGCTILFVSHNLAAIQALCDRCIMLRHGKLVLECSPEKVANEYLQVMTQQDGSTTFSERTHRTGNGDAHFTAIRLCNDAGQTTGSIPMGKGMRVELSFDLKAAMVEDPSFMVTVHTGSGQPVMRFATHESVGELPPVRSSGTVSVEVPQTHLMHGTYYLSVAMLSRGVEVDRVDEAIQLDVSPWAVEGAYPTGKVPPARAGLLAFEACGWSTDYAS